MANIDRTSLPAGVFAGSEAGVECAIERAILTSCVLAWLGATISTLLLHSDSEVHALLCPVRVGCEAVLSSRYAAMLGIPLPWYGVGFYLSLLVLLLTAYGTASRRSRVRLLGAGLSLSVIGASASAVMMFIQFGVLRAFCPLCTASALVSASLVVASAQAERRAEKADFRGHRAGALALGMFALVSAAPHLVSGTSARSGVLALVDGEAFTRKQMEEEMGASLQTLQRSIYAIEFEWVRRKVEGALLAAEAKKAKTTVPELLAAQMGAVKPGSDMEIDARLASKGLARTPETAAPIRDELLAERRELARVAYLEELAKNHRVEVFLKQPPVTALKIDLAGAKVSGPQDAKVQLVVFSDFECQHCADLSSVLTRARAEFPKEVMVAFRQFPIERHQHALPAAIAAECAAEQGKFWEYHDKLHAQRGDLSDAAIASIATALNLDEARFRECQASGRARAAVEASRADAIKNGLEGVPALFLNGKKIGGMIEYEHLAEKIRGALKNSTTATGDTDEKDREEAK